VWGVFDVRRWDVDVATSGRAGVAADVED